jgi:hypothetical protein
LTLLILEDHQKISRRINGAYNIIGNMTRSLEDSSAFFSKDLFDEI